MSLESITQAIRQEISKLNQVLRLLEGGAKKATRGMGLRFGNDRRGEDRGTPGTSAATCPGDGGNRIRKKARTGWNRGGGARDASGFRQKMDRPEAQKQYRRSSRVIEFCHVWIKSELGLRQFHLRGLAKAQMEMLWACLTDNLHSACASCQSHPPPVKTKPRDRNREGPLRKPNYASTFPSAINPRASSGLWEVVFRSFLEKLSRLPERTHEESSLLPSTRIS